MKNKITSFCSFVLVVVFLIVVVFFIFDDGLVALITYTYLSTGLSKEGEGENPRNADIRFYIRNRTLGAQSNTYLKDLLLFFYEGGELFFVFHHRTWHFRCCFAPAGERERYKDSVWRDCLFILLLLLLLVWFLLGPGGRAQRINGWANVLSPDPMESWTQPKFQSKQELDLGSMVLMGPGLDIIWAHLIFGQGLD